MATRKKTNNKPSKPRASVEAVFTGILTGLGSQVPPNDLRDAAVRAVAHSLWESMGRQHGQHEQHWLAAERAISAAINDGVADPSKIVATARMISSKSQQRN